MARGICPDESSLLFAHILQTFGSSKFQVNNLLESRKDLEQALKIRQENDLVDRVGLTNCYHLNANLLSAEGNPAKALEFWEICTDVLSITVAAGDSGALITIYLGCGRAHCLLGNYEEAEKFFKLAEATVIPAIRPQNHFSPQCVSFQ
jgi:tetratricopeptide (TPR) repeat protein